MSGCEVVANFDERALDDRTIGPTPIPQLDGAVASMPDASMDGAIVQPESDASRPDAGNVGDGGNVLGPEPSVDTPASVDGGLDAGT